MTPAARLSAAIEVLDQHLGGTPAEKALTNWGRRSRFAGSKDRAAVRDIVFDCLRCKASFAHRAGSSTGRGLVSAWAAGSGDKTTAQALFSGEGHAPPPLSAHEQEMLFGADRAQELSAQYDLPDWLVESFRSSLGAEEAMNTAQVLRSRAPMFLRVALSRGTRKQAMDALAADGVISAPHEEVSTALEVLENPRRVAQSRAYLDGRVEIQDAASQAICQGLPEAGRMLDYCAGGGGKVLAYGDRGMATLFAHDANQARLRDLPERAKRARLSITTLDAAACKKAAPFDLVLVDAPCSGSGTWRRAPEAKWSLTPEKLAELVALQAEIIDQAAGLVAPGGCLAYATCSVLNAENSEKIQRFMDRSSHFEVTHQEQFLPSALGDGFFVAHLTRHETAA